MNRTPIALPVAVPVALCLTLIGTVAACTSETRPDSSTGTTTEPAAEVSDTSTQVDLDYVLLLDDDSRPDQIMERPGSYVMTPRGETPTPQAVVDVPAGYENFGFFALNATTGPFQAVQYWTAHGVPRDPCRYSAPAPRVVGPSVDAFVDAIVRQESDATDPQPVTLDGHDGMYLELTAPSDVDELDCSSGYYVTFEGRRGDSQHTVEGGHTDRIWVIDVDGQRVVLIAISDPALPQAEVDELVEIVESVRFLSY